MIAYIDALNLVLDSAKAFGSENIALEDSLGRIVDEDIRADRDFPPFDRVTKDGVAIKFSSFYQGNRAFRIQEVAAAGDPQKTLNSENDCIEVMTGAMLPINTDTVIMYEEINIKDGIASISNLKQKGQNIHLKGIDQKKDNILLRKNTRITNSAIGILATVGKTKVEVKKLPKVAIVSTGNELVSLEQSPKPHQIRASNSMSLKVLLKDLKIEAQSFHIADDKIFITDKLKEIFQKFDVLMMSGGVSMGKFDLIPEILKNLGATKAFHRVAQRPGKPFWFGTHDKTKTTIFSFPGNPVSTFVNYHIYFKPWLSKSLLQPIKKSSVKLNFNFESSDTLTRFILVNTTNIDGNINADLVGNNGSGDLVSLNESTGVVIIHPDKDRSRNDLVEYIGF